MNQRLLLILACLLVPGASPGACQQLETPTRRLETQEIQMVLNVVNEDGSVDDLFKSEVHVSVDGRVAQISRFELNLLPDWEVYDNLGHHCEDVAGEGRGIWSRRDIPVKRSSECGPTKTYIISVLEPQGLMPGCHAMKTKIDRRGIRWSTRREYCDGSSAENPLFGSKTGLLLAADANGPKPGRIKFTGKAGVLLLADGTYLGEIELALPSSALQQAEARGRCRSEVNIAGYIVNPAEVITGRFSDNGTCSPGYDCRFTDPDTVYPDLAIKIAPHGYERQVPVSSGESKIVMAIRNGHESGRAVLPLSVPVRDDTKPWLSSVFICKRLHTPERAPYEFDLRPHSYKALVSGSEEFTPAGDTRFHSEERMFLWFQVVPPSAQGTLLPLRYQVAISDSATGKSETASPLTDVPRLPSFDNAVSGITKAINLTGFAAGHYQVEVRVFGPGPAEVVKSVSTFEVY